MEQTRHDIRVDRAMETHCPIFIRRTTMSYKTVLPPQFHLGCELRSEHHQCSHVCFKHDASCAASGAASEEASCIASCRASCTAGTKSEIEVLLAVCDGETPISERRFL